MTWQLVFDHIDRLIALVLILTAALLLLLGVDSEVKTILIMAGGWAFGSTYQARKVTKK